MIDDRVWCDMPFKSKPQKKEVYLNVSSFVYWRFFLNGKKKEKRKMGLKVSPVMFGLTHGLSSKSLWATHHLGKLSILGLHLGWVQSLLELPWQSRYILGYMDVLRRLIFRLAACGLIIWSCWAGHIWCDISHFSNIWTLLDFVRYLRSFILSWS